MNFNKVKFLKVLAIIFLLILVILSISLAITSEYVSLADFFIICCSPYYFGILLAPVIFWYIYSENNRYMNMMSIIRYTNINQVIKKQIVFVIKISFFTTIFIICIIFTMGIFLADNVINWGITRSICYETINSLLPEIEFYQVIILTSIIVFLRILIIGLISIVVMWSVKNMMFGYILLIILALVDTKSKVNLFYNVISNSYIIYKHQNLQIYLVVFVSLIILILLTILNNVKKGREFYNEK